MKKVYVFMLLSVLFCCAQPNTIKKDKDREAPNEVSNLIITEGNGQLLLSWSQPGNKDFAVVEITYSIDGDPSTSAILVGKGTTSATLTGLANGTMYELIFKTIDKNGNKSDGITKYGLPSDFRKADITSLNDGFHSSPHIAVDKNNKIHLCFYDSSDGYLKYATNKTGSWIISNIVSDAYYCCIATDSGSNVHIAYFDTNSSTLKYVTNKTGSWTFTALDTVNINGWGVWWVSMAIDKTDFIHLVYVSYNANSLNYATNKTGAWVCAPVDSNGLYPSIALDSHNHVHITYSCGNIKYATNAAGAWAFTDIGAADYSNLAIDSNDKVNVCMCYCTTGIKYETNATGSWVYSVFDSYDNLPAGYSGGDNYNPGISIDPNGDVYTCYIDFISELKYATNKSGVWKYYMIEPFFQCEKASMAMDSNGKMHIIYYSGDKLIYATNAD